MGYKLLNVRISFYTLSSGDITRKLPLFSVFATFASSVLLHDSVIEGILAWRIEFKAVACIRFMGIVRVGWRVVV